LLHDLGNIVKFNFNQTKEIYPELFVKPEAREYWEKIKQEFIKKYGTGSHNVTMKILLELGVSERIRELVDCVALRKVKATRQLRILAEKFALTAICGFCRTA